MYERLKTPIFIKTSEGVSENIVDLKGINKFIFLEWCRIAWLYVKFSYEKAL